MSISLERSSTREIIPLNKAIELERKIRSNGMAFEFYEWGHYASMSFEGEYELSTVVEGDELVTYVIVNSGQNAVIIPSGIELSDGNFTS